MTRCGCEWNYCCSKCSGDPQHDYTLAFVADPAEDRDDAQRAADHEAHLAEIGGPRWETT